MNPDWWTDVHDGPCRATCWHGKARHVCLSHCPVLADCAVVLERWGDDWKGMVVAGTLRSVRHSQPVAAKIQPHPLGGTAHCAPCRQRL